MEKLKLIKINLQFFGEGGGAAGGEGGGGATGGDGTSGVSAGASLPATKGVNSNPLANVIYGKQDADVSAAGVQNKANTDIDADAKARFDEYRKGEGKAYFDEWANETIQKRLKATKDTVDKYNELSPVLDMLGRKYGVDPSDVKALNKAIEEDDSYYEDEALERGISVEQLKEIRKMERENAELKKKMHEEQVQKDADRILAGWMQEADSLKKVYPSFDFKSEMQNQQFRAMLESHVNMKSAFEVLHKDEIIPAAMQYTAKTVEQKLASKMMANGNRPTENGMSGNATAVIKSDVAQLSKEDREEIIRRVARGEKIRF